MSDTDKMDTNAAAVACRVLARPLSESQHELGRDVLSRLSGKWPMWVLHVLAEANAPMRFTRLQLAVDGITQKVLTRTLRHLECDGFVTRTQYPTVPPRVDYALTDLGSELLIRTAPLVAWIFDEWESFAVARSRFGKARSEARPVDSSQ